MALLNDTLEPSRVRAFSKEWKTTMKIWPNGRTTTKKNWATPLHNLTVDYEGITLAEYNLLKDFFDSVFGKFGVFTVRDNHTNTVYTVRFADDRLSRQNVRPNVRGLYAVRLRMTEDKA